MPRRRKRVSVRGYGGGYALPEVPSYGSGIATIGPIVKGATEGFVEGLKLRQEGNRLRQQAAQQELENTYKASAETRAIEAEKRAAETHAEGLTENRLKTGREIITEAAKTEPILPTGVSREIVKGRLPTEILAESGLPPEVKAQMGQQVEQQFITRGVPKEVAPTLAKQYPYGVESIDWAKVREMRQKYGAEALSGIEKVGEEGYKSQQDIENALKLERRKRAEGITIPPQTPGQRRAEEIKTLKEKEQEGFYVKPLDPQKEFSQKQYDSAVKAYERELNEKLAEIGGPIDNTPAAWAEFRKKNPDRAQEVEQEINKTKDKWIPRLKQLEVEIWGGKTPLPTKPLPTKPLPTELPPTELPPTKLPATIQPGGYVQEWINRKKGR